MEKRLRDIGLVTLGLFSENPLTELDHPLSHYHLEKITKLIDETRQALAPDDQQLGVWETVELNIAEEALRAGFVRTALISVAKAMAVFQLGEDEYAYGCKQLNQKNGSISPSSISTENLVEMPRISPAVLLQEEKQNAKNLLASQEKMAKELKAAQYQDALYLKKEQEYEALWLQEEQRQEAAEYADISATEIVTFAAIEARRNIYQEELEEIIIWSMGSYSTSCPQTRKETLCACEVMLADRIAAADRLRKHQESAAQALREEQERAAALLLAAQSAAAERLKEEQRLAAVELVERQAVRALRRKISAETQTD